MFKMTPSPQKQSLREMIEAIKLLGCDDDYNLEQFSVVKQVAILLAEAVEFYAEIHPDKPSAALCVDKFDWARRAQSEAKKILGGEK